MDKEFSEQLQALRVAVTEAMRNSEPVEKAIRELLHRSGADGHIEINLVLLGVEPEVEAGATTLAVGLLGRSRRKVDS